MESNISQILSIVLLLSAYPLIAMQRQTPQSNLDRANRILNHLMPEKIEPEYKKSLEILEANHKKRIDEITYNYKRLKSRIEDSCMVIEPNRLLPLDKQAEIYQKYERSKEIKLETLKDDRSRAIQQAEETYKDLQQSLKNKYGIVDQIQ